MKHLLSSICMGLLCISVWILAAPILTNNNKDQMILKADLDKEDLNKAQNKH